MEDTNHLSCVETPQWHSPLKLEFIERPKYSFRRFNSREAFVLENKIVYFGSQNIKATFVLEQEEETELLKIISEDEGFDLEKGLTNTASCGFTNEIYAFKTWNYEEVHRYSLETGKWSLYFRYDSNKKG